MRKHLKRISAIFLCLLMLTFVVPAPAHAAAPDITGKKCNLTLNFYPAVGKSSGTSFSLYKIASMNPSGDFSAEKAFDTPAVTNLLKDVTKEKFMEISGIASDIVLTSSGIKAVGSAGTDAEGNAFFPDAEPGLYLVQGEILQDGDIFYIPQNFVVSLPGKSVEDEWQYDIQASVKWEERSSTEPFDLKVIKTWTDSALNLHEEDEITAELYKDGALFDKQILSKKNNWTYTWKKLDPAAVWNVKETEFKGYAGTVERKGDVFVITNTPDTPQDIPSLPITGYFWWPVLLIFGVGVIFIMIGLYVRRKGKRNETT